MHREDIRRVYEWMKKLRCIRENWVIVTLVDRVSGRMHSGCTGVDLRMVWICVFFSSTDFSTKNRSFSDPSFSLYFLDF